MAGRITIDVGLNTREVAKGAKDAEKALENLEDAVSDAGKGGAKDLKTLERELKDVQDAGEKAGKGISDGVGKGLNTVKDEADSTAREAAASFDGSAESIADAFQEVAANAFSGFGPAGAVAGIAAAAGIGLAAAGFTAADEAAQASKERVADWADAFIEAGGKALTAGVQAARFEAILTDTEKFAEAERNAKTWGVSIETAISAMSGNQGAIDDVTESVRDMGDALEEASKKEGVDLDPAGTLAAQTNLYNAASDSLGKLTGEMEQGQARAKLLSGYYVDLINSTEGVTKEVDGLGNELYTLPDETQILIDAKTQQATQNVDAFKGDLDGIPEEVTSRVRVIVDDNAAWAALNRLTAPKSVDMRVKPRGTAEWQ